MDEPETPGENERVSEADTADDDKTVAGGQAEETPEVLVKI